MGWFVLVYVRVPVSRCDECIALLYRPDLLFIHLKRACTRRLPETFHIQKERLDNKRCAGPVKEDRRMRA